MKNAVLFYIIIFSAINLHAQWDSFTMPSFRVQGASAVCYEDVVYLAGGRNDSTPLTRIDLFNTNTNEWSEKELPTARLFPAAVIADNKLFYAGGLSFQPLNNFDEVEIYDFVQETWITQTLSQARMITMAANAGNKVVFGGGVILENNSPLELSSSDVVDIYDTSTGTWEVAQLSEARSLGTAVAFGDKIYFAGGHNNGITSKRIDIYDTTNNTWSIDSLSVARYHISSAVAGDMILFVGGAEGNGNQASSIVDIINGVTGEKMTANIPNARAGAKAATIGNKAFFANGGNNDVVTSSFSSATNWVDVYDADTGEWTVLNTSISRVNHSACSCNNKLYVAGGTDINSLNNIMEEYTPEFINRIVNPSNIAISVFPNPVEDQINIRLENAGSNSIKHVQLQSMEGKVIYERSNLNSNSIDFNLDHLPEGMLILSIDTMEGVTFRKIIKN